VLFVRSFVRSRGLAGTPFRPLIDLTLRRAGWFFTRIHQIDRGGFPIKNAERVFFIARADQTFEVPYVKRSDARGNVPSSEARARARGAERRGR
jgi:hypothetical protein